MQNRYITIDFETANAKRVSACSIGVAVIEDGHVVDTFTSLIKPPPSYDSFAPINVKIHGITFDMVANAPTFDELYPSLRQIAAGAPILGYSKFDRSVLQQLAEYYSLPISRTRIDGYIDVCSLAQRTIPQLANHKLNTVAKHLELGEFRHHDASDDATMCALVFLALNGINVSPEETCRTICRKPLDAAPVDKPAPSNVEYEGSELCCPTPVTDQTAPRSSTDVVEAFATFASLILDDGIVDYKEAIELRCFLSVISPTRGVEKLTNILDIFLEDGVIDTDESSTLVELILDVSAELTGKSFISCPRCGAPLRNEQSEAILSCTWCGAPLFV